MLISQRTLTVGIARALLRVRHQAQEETGTAKLLCVHLQQLSSPVPDCSSMPRKLPILGRLLCSRLAASAARPSRLTSPCRPSGLCMRATRHASEASLCRCPRAAKARRRPSCREGALLGPYPDIIDMIGYGPSSQYDGSYAMCTELVQQPRNTPCIDLLAQPK